LTALVALAGSTPRGSPEHPAFSYKTRIALNTEEHPVTLITAKQELILVVAVPNHRRTMPRSRPQIKNIEEQSRPDIEHRKIRHHDFSLPHTWSFYSQLNGGGSTWDPILVMAFVFASYVLRRSMRANRWSI
jgi:hypothetical protein